ncbi:MAG TPA: ester cyclase [Pyrinomonadaceae bacterium]
MMSKENVALIHRWFEEVWNKGRAEAIDEMFAEDGIAHGLGSEGETLQGPAGFRPFFENFRGAFPDIRVTIEDTVAEGDKLAARWVGRMTHRGDHLGVPASGQAAEITGMCIVRIRDGQIVEAWNNFDMMGLMQQIGAI